MSTEINVNGTAPRGAPGDVRSNATIFRRALNVGRINVPEEGIAPTAVAVKEAFPMQELRAPSERDILARVEVEASLILRRAALEPPPLGQRHLESYLRMMISRAVPILTRLARDQPLAGELLDVGAGYGLIGGTACQFGWRVSAVDASPIPEASGLRQEHRRVAWAVAPPGDGPWPFDAERFSAIVLGRAPASHALREIRRTLRPDGRLYLAISPRHVDGLRRTLASSGLHVSAISHHGKVHPFGDGSSAWHLVKSRLRAGAGALLHRTPLLANCALVVAVCEQGDIAANARAPGRTIARERAYPDRPNARAAAQK